MYSLGKEIQEKRKKAKMSQKECAEKLYLSESTLSQLETNKKLPDITELVSICNLFKVSADDLLGLPNNLKYLKTKRTGLSNIIQNIREEAGETEKDFAYKIDVSISTLKKYEGNHRTPPLHRIIKIAKVYNYSVDYLLEIQRGDSKC